MSKCPMANTAAFASFTNGATNPECPIAKSDCPILGFAFESGQSKAGCPAVDSRCPILANAYNSRMTGNSGHSKSACPIAQSQCPILQYAFESNLTKRGCPAANSRCPVLANAYNSYKAKSGFPAFANSARSKSACPIAKSDCPILQYAFESNLSKPGCPAANSRCSVLANAYNSYRMNGGNNYLPTGNSKCPMFGGRHAGKENQKYFSKDGFETTIDLHHFKPNEVKVRTVDNTIVVEAKHEEKDDGSGPVERNFIRKYDMPKDYDMSKVQSSLSSDGVLTIKAPAKPSVEKAVQITHTNKPADLCRKESGAAVASPSAAKTPK